MKKLNFAIIVGLWASLFLSSYAEDLVGKQITDEKQAYNLNPIEIFANEADESSSGKVIAASKMEVIENKGDWLQVALTGWYDTAGRGSVLVQEKGKRILIASIKGDIKASEEVLKTEKDDVSETDWNEVKVIGYIKNENLVDSVEPIWAFEKTHYETACSTCHTVTEISHYDANSWIATLKGMAGYSNLTKDQEARMLKYLQNHASDMVEESH